MRFRISEPDDSEVVNISLVQNDGDLDGDPCVDIMFNEQLVGWFSSSDGSLYLYNLGNDDIDNEDGLPYEITDDGYIVVVEG